MEPSETTGTTIGRLWEQRRHDRFPEALRGAEVESVDVATLDAFCRGCLQTFVQQGRLDAWRAALLGLCYRDLALVVRALEGQAYVYFLHLEELAGLVLQEVVQQGRGA